MFPNHIAIVGGGITGLSSAFHLSRRFPQCHITLLEKSAREGGWINSRRVSVKDGEGNNADICLEAGPRTLRPNNRAVLELINLLGLNSSVITTPRTSPAAKYRFLHIPGSEGLTALPASVWSLFTSPVTSILLPAILREPWSKSNRLPGATDESFDGLLTRRFGSEFARTFGSALVHGIYAADSRVLSVRATFPTLWEAEERGGGSIVRGFLRRKTVTEASPSYDLGDTLSMMNGVSVYSFTDGIETLTRALSSALDNSPNVTRRTGFAANALRLSDRSDDIEIGCTSGEIVTASHVVSAVPLPALQRLLPPGHTLSHLTTNPLSTVTVINIIFPPTKTPIHPQGFGYLIPRPARGYSPHNPGILGAVFDSSSLAAQDGDQRMARFTKLTMMLGGPYTLSPAHTTMPTVLEHLQRHLRPAEPLPEPLFFESHEQKDCIPTPTVGHLQRMKELKIALGERPWGGRLEVVGAGVGGVSVGDCVEAGRTVGQNW